MNIVGPHLTESRGGMSTALLGFIEALKSDNYSINMIASQKDKSNILTCWIYAFTQLWALTKNEQKNTVFWFHMGPWLSMIRKSSLALLVKLRGGQSIAHFHSPTLDGYANKCIGRLFIRICLLPYKEIIVLTPWWKKRLQAIGIKKAIYVVSNPLETDLVELAKAQLMNEKNETDRNRLSKNNHGYHEPVHIVTMARLIEGKGVELVISAMLDLPDNYQLSVAGDGPLLSELQHLVKANNLEDRVTFLGWIDKTHKLKLYSQADIFCLPSSYDSFGMVFIEAMALNTPVIAYDWGPIGDVVTPDVGYCLTQVKEREELTRAIKTMSAQLSYYDKKGPQRVVKHFSQEQVAEQFKLALQSMLNE